MKSPILSGIVVILALLVTSGSSQTPAAAANEHRLLSLVQEIQSQQAQLAANQDKIDSKLAEVSEAVRMARIFAGRGGK